MEKLGLGHVVFKVLYDKYYENVPGTARPIVSEIQGQNLI